MSKEVVRQLVEYRFNSFVFGDEFFAHTSYADKTKKTDASKFTKYIVDWSRKSYPNHQDKPTPTSGRWLRLHDIGFGLHNVASIGSEPCTRRTGVIVIDAFERLDVGTRRIYELTDAVEQWFGLWTSPEGNFWTDPANTVNFPNDGNGKSSYHSRIYIPFTYDPN